MSSSPDTTIMMCANCGKGEDSAGDLKACTACKLVKYCNRDCQIAHRPQHKKACKKRAAELHDEALFKQPPPTEDCPICMLPLPFEKERTTYYPCCGKYVCGGCIYAMAVEGIDKELEEHPYEHLCAFCRTPEASSDEEKVRRLEKLVETGNVVAIFQQGNNYAIGSHGLQQDRVKAAELYLKAGELGCAEAYCKLGCLYTIGQGVERDGKKAKHYYELAAMMGDADARYALGRLEGVAGNAQRAQKHYMIAARAGCKESLKKVKEGYMKGIVTKDEYGNLLRAYQKRQDELKSDARDESLKFV